MKTYNKVGFQQQPRVSIFDTKHSAKSSSSKNSPISPSSNKEQKLQNKPIFFGNIPATNIFSINAGCSNPIPNIFATSNPPLQVNRSVSNTTINIQSGLKKVQEEKQEKTQQKIQTFSIIPQQIPINISLPKAQQQKNSQTGSSQQSKKINQQENDKNNRQQRERKSQFDTGKKSSEKFDSGKKISEKSSDQVSAFSGNVDENRSRGSSIYSFQKKFDSKKMENGQQNMGEYSNQQEEIFSFEQKFQTPTKKEEKQQDEVRDENLLSTIRQIQGEQSSFHRIEITDTYKSSKKSSIPPYMEESISSSLTYMENLTSKMNTTSNIEKPMMQSYTIQQKQNSNSNILIHSQNIQIKTQSQNIVRLRKSEEQIKNQAFQLKMSTPQQFIRNQSQHHAQKSQRQNGKHLIPLKEFFLTHSAIKSSQQQFPKVQIKRTQSQSDSQSHSFSSKDFETSRNEQKTIRTPFGQPRGKFANLKRINANSIKVKIQSETKSERKISENTLILGEKKQKLQHFVQVQQPLTNIKTSLRKNGQQEQISDDDIQNLSKTNSLDYSDIRQKIESSTNTLIRSLQKDEERIQKIEEKVTSKNIAELNKNIEEVKKNEIIKLLEHEDETNLEVPQRLDGRKITFGKNLQTQSHSKFVSEYPQVKKMQNKIKIENQKNLEENKKQLLKRQKQEQLEKQNKYRLLNKQKQQSNLNKKDQITEQSAQKIKGQGQIKPQLTQSNYSLLKKQIHQTTQNMHSIFQTYKNKYQTYKEQMQYFQLFEFRSTLQYISKRLEQLIIYSFSTQNYLHLNKSLLINQKIETKTKDLDDRILKLELYEKYQQKWIQKTSEINNKYFLSLQQEKKIIYQQKQKKKGNSFFSFFNLKKNKYCIHNPQTSTLSLSKQQNQYPKSKQFLKSTFKQIIDQKTSSSLAFQQKTQQIINIKIKKVSMPNLVKINTAKIEKPYGSRLSQILREKNKQCQQIKIKTKKQFTKQYSRLFREISQTRKNNYFTLDYCKNINKNFMRNFQNMTLASQNFKFNDNFYHKNYIQQDSKQKTQRLKQIIEYQKRKQIKDFYQSQQKAYKRLKNMIGQDYGLFQTKDQKFEQKQRKKMQMINNKSILNQQIQIKMNDNVSVKLRNINFRIQVFWL